MSMNYIPMSTPDVSSIRKNMLVRIDDDIQKDSLLDPKPEEDTPPVSDDHKELLDSNLQDPTGADIVKASLSETNNYDPDFASASPISGVDHDITQPDTRDDPSLLGEDPNKPGEVISTDPPNPNEIPPDVMNIEEDVHKFASDYDDYYNEAAMKAKVRNQLPDSEFGIPRLRKYPLNDEKHVRMAISMFGHCKDPKDKVLLAKRIFAKVKEFNIDITIGKNSALYEYAPKALQEATIVPTMNEEEIQVYGLEKPMEKRTKEEIVREHLSRNSLFYNNLFYNEDFAKSIKAIKTFTFFDYFYPSFKTHTFYSRLKTALGGIGMDKDLYRKFGMRYPLDTKFVVGENWIHIEDEDLFTVDVQSTGNDQNTWFHVDTTDDMDHVKYCMALYSILGEMMINPNFRMDALSPNQLGILTDWSQMIVYNWDLMMQEEKLSPKYLYYAQKLHDLFWDCVDNPFDSQNAAANVISMVQQMPSAQQMVANMNEGTELISKEDCAGYLSHELGLEDDLFLLPTTMEYPIFNQGSVRLAMDMINRIPRDVCKEFSKNLNRKYKELGCTFSISVDHPYAKYADQNIIDHMNRVLIEGDTAVSDQGTSMTSLSMDTEPWYKRLDVNGNVPQNLLDNRELGPNDKKYPNPDFSRYQSVF